MGKILIKSTEGGFKFELITETVIASSRIYKSIPNCKIGIESVKKNVVDAVMERE